MPKYEPTDFLNTIMVAAVLERTQSTISVWLAKARHGKHDFPLPTFQRGRHMYWLAEVIYTYKNTHPELQLPPFIMIGDDRFRTGSRKSEIQRRHESYKRRKRHCVICNTLFKGPRNSVVCPSKECHAAYRHNIYWQNKSRFVAYSQKTMEKRRQKAKLRRAYALMENLAKLEKEMENGLQAKPTVESVS
jgi:hypothetical protein